MLLGVYEYSPTGGSSYIPQTKDIATKKAFVNPHNNEQLCLQWAILAKHVTVNNKRRVNHNYTLVEDKYNFSGLSHPTPLYEVKLFEKNNSTVSVIVYGLK